MKGDAIMKTSIKAIGYGLLVMCMLLMGMPVMAQQQEWRSTSAMRTSGSTYSPQITAVGATTVSSMATTTETYSPAKAPGSGPRRGFDTGAETQQSEEFPIGDAVLPLALMALTFAGVVYFRKRKARV